MSTKVSRRSFVQAAAGVSAALAAGAGVSALAADGKAPAAKDASAAADGSTATDFKGREVTIPEKVERVAITCMGGATQEVCVLGAADRIVVQPSMQKAFSMLVEMYPQFAEIPDGGSFDDVNVETVAAAEPDIVFVSSTSDKGNAKLDETGLLTYTLSTANATVDSLREEYHNVSRILGNPDRGDSLLEFWDEVMGAVDTAAATIDEDKKLKVYRCGAEITKANHTVWAGTWIKAAGGVPAAEDNTTGDVGIEQIANWNPDVIICSDPESVLTNDSLQDIAAVKNGAVFATPKFSIGWDIPSPEVPLGFAWLGQKLYPEAFADIDLRAELKGFYATFYDYELTDEKIDELMK